MSVSAPTATCRFSQAASNSSQGIRRTVLPRTIHTTRFTPEEQPPFQKPVAETPPSQPHRNRAPKQYPLYPSVAHLLRTNNIPLSSASSIPASGPAGRLLKGDVLAHLGRIQKSYSKEQSSRITKLGHLDLTNYQKAAPKAAATSAEGAAPPSQTKKSQEQKQEIDTDTQIVLPISLSAVLATQKRIQQSLGLTLPLSTFIARASEIANRDLPTSRAKGTAAAALTADELFDAVLGLDQVAAAGGGTAKKAKTSTGSYTLQITSLAPENGAARSTKSGTTPHRSARKADVDIIDMLTGSGRRSGVKTTPPVSNVGDATAGVKDSHPFPGVNNVFSVAARKGEERRARTYLERVKTVLEAEPGRCVL